MNQSHANENTLSTLPNNFAPLLALTPFEQTNASLVAAIIRQQVPVVVDLGRDSKTWAATLNTLAAHRSEWLGLRVPDFVDVGALTLPESVRFLVLPNSAVIPQAWRKLPVIAQVISCEEAEQALAMGAEGLIAKGQESGGVCGAESAFVLLQRVLLLANAKQVPVWCQGGMSLNTAVAAMVAGAAGVVIDAILSVFPESDFSAELKQRVLALDGSEVRALAGFHVLAPKGSAAIELNRSEVLEQLGDQRLLAVGQDAALARLALNQCTSVASLIRALRTRMQAALIQAQSLQPLADGNAWARAHGTRYGIAQGPMTRVSDTAPFAAAVAEAGALPFIALSLMNAQSSRTLLEDTKAALGDKPWGVGVLGFAEADVLAPQLELVREFMPPVLLIAGGRPSQAKPFTDMGIATYLHVPSPGLLDLFIAEGATHFVFEGRECGGHVGPRYSFVLWEQALTRLLADEHPERFHVLLAGGIHDALSAAMASALLAPLAARGAKVGVLMGTAYIATHEAVSAGAVLPRFQQQAIASQSTELVETAPGHAIRCVPSGFTQLFEREKARLQALAIEPKQIWKDLEALTIGRLRVASKGVDRVDGVLQAIDEQTQADEGMYMLGQVAVMADEVIAMAELHRRVCIDSQTIVTNCPLPSFSNEKSQEPIAIVGMSCLFAGSPDLEAYWENILSGRDLVTEVPSDRWSVEQYFHADEARQDKSISRWGAFIPDTPFDPLTFGIPPASLAAIEPVQLLSLSIAQQALVDANYSQRWFDRERTSVIFGAEAGMDLGNQYTFRNLWQQYAGELPPALAQALPTLTEDSFPGMLVNLISGRIANRLGLGGVNYAVTSACASSLTAVDLAVKELRGGSSDMVLAGGADFHNGISDYLMFSSVGALSASGRCRSFDHQADGIALGEGIGIVVLKRLSDAQRDGDRIYALIDGVAGSSDGKGLGLTAPRKDGQKLALERTYAQAGILPGAIELIEAHGTGTVVGDRTELQALTDVFSQGGAMPAQAALGSVKSQIGHTKCAAGVAGLIKVAKALHHRVLPGTQNISQPNAWHNAATSPFTFSAQPRPWLMPAEQAARGAVSAFGFGGANFHAVLSAWPEHQSAVGAMTWPAELFLLRGKDLSSAKAELTNLQQFLSASDVMPSLRDLAFTLWQAGSGPIQMGFVATDITSLKQQISDALAGKSGVAIRDADQAVGKVAFIFPGQGSQYVGMLRDLFIYFPELQHLLLNDAAVAAAIYPPSAYSAETAAEQQRHLTDTRQAQPALGMVDMAAFECLQALGIKPDMAAGHSYGELAALSAAGVYDAAALINLSRARAEAMMSVAGDDAGCMAAISLSARELAPMLSDFTSVVMANQNSPQQTVISGPTLDVEAALVALRDRGVAGKAIDTACAFHSPLMAAASERFAVALGECDMNPSAWPIYANVTAAVHATESDAIRSSLSQHIVSPVRFVDEIEQMYADGARTFIEVGPRRVLTGLVGRILTDKAHTAIALDQEGKGLAGLLSSLAKMAVALPEFNADKLFAGRAKLVDLSQPKRWSATTWMVNGGRAWPIKGKLPAHAGQIVKAPVVHLGAATGFTGTSAMPHVAERDQALAGYLNNMRELVSAQRDVLLGYMGAPAAPVFVRGSPAAQIASPVFEGHAVAPQEVLAAAVELDHTSVLLNLVSERTGYPSDMLDLDLDLEADLSIDSIKRLEVVGELARVLDLRAKLGADAETRIEALTRQKTLRAVIDWLREHVPMAMVVAPALQPAAATSLASVQWDRPFLQRTLLMVVSEATGYPEEALDLDLDLEADLSIDSIKRLEVIGQLKRALSEANAAQAAALSVEELSSCKTLSAILDTALASSQPAPTVTLALQETEDVAIEFPFQRVVFRNQKTQNITANWAALAGQHTVIIAPNGKLGTMLSEQLSAHQVKATLLNLAEAGTYDFAQTNALLDLSGLDFTADAHLLVQQFAVLQSALLARVSRLLVATALGGDFGLAAPQLPRGGGIAGMIKTMAREYEQTNVRCLDIDADESDEQLADYIARELTSNDRLVEVAWVKGQRWQRQVTALAPSAGELAELPLSKDSVVLLTGGARGITALMAIELAQRFQCQLELVGRSALPIAEESAATKGVTDQRQLRQALLSENPSRKPAEVESLVRRVLAERDISATFAAIKAAGGRVNYHALDVRDESALTTLVADIYARAGRIDGVFHGAGIVEDKLIRDKQQDSFARVYGTKVASALSLLACIRNDVKCVVFFSSVASAFGNRGQVDYAAANDMLDKIAHHWQSRISGRVLSVNWGPWADTGMVSPALQREYARKGIGLIPQKVGVAALFSALVEPSRETQIVMVSGEVGRFMSDASTPVGA